MTKDEFIAEMLNEVKNLKDLAKGELPIIAQEYITAQRIKVGAALSLGVLLILSGMGGGLYAYLHEFPSTYNGHDNQMGISAISGMGVFIGCIITMCNLDSLVDLLFQPRRMAIKAITSLK